MHTCVFDVNERKECGGSNDLYGVSNLTKSIFQGSLLLCNAFFSKIQNARTKLLDFYAQ